MGGLLARRSDPTRVALIAQLGALALTLPLAIVFSGSSVTAADVAWGAASGVGTGVAMVFLYRGLAHGDFSAVVPLAAVGGVAIPVFVGVAVLGDRPSAAAWLGVVLAVPALWLMLRTARPASSAVRFSAGTAEAVLASGGIALQYLALAQADTAAGLWPIAAGRVTALAAVAPFALGPAREAVISARDTTAAALTGVGAALALFLYLLAANEGMLAVTVVLASLYPVVPVFVGIAWYGEPLSKPKTVGLLTAAVAVALLSTG